MTDAQKERACSWQHAYRQRNLEKVRAFDRAQGQKHRVRKLAYMKRYRADNADAISATKKRCYEKNPGKYKAMSRAWIDANRPRWSAQCKAWKVANAGYVKDLNHAYYTANKKRHRELGKAWAAKNPEKCKASRQRQYAARPEKWRADNFIRRARKQNAPGKVTPAQIKARIEFYGGCCAYCSKPYEHLDHVIPLSRGGSNLPANIRPTCAKCNLSKGAKRLREWKVAV